MSERYQKSYIRIDTRTGQVEVVRGWPPHPAESLEVTTLLYTGTVGLIRTLLQLFPEQRKAVSEYLRDVAKCIDEGTW